MSSLESNLEHSASYNEAIVIYKQGMRKEDRGDLDEAIRLYKKAMRIVPEIDVIIRQLISSDQLRDIDEADEDDEGDVEFYPTSMHPALNTFALDDMTSSHAFGSSTAETRNDLIKSFSSDLVNEPFIPVAGCHPSSQTHISKLPNELILRVFRWVIGPSLDIRSLEILSRVCKGFYLLSRDERLWRKTANRLWNFEVPSGNSVLIEQMSLASQSSSRSSSSSRRRSTSRSKVKRPAGIRFKPPHGQLKIREHVNFNSHYDTANSDFEFSSSSEEESIVVTLSVTNDAKPALKFLPRPFYYGPYQTWRDLVIYTPHLYFNGVYVCRIDYGHLGGMSLDLKPMDSVSFNIRYFRVLKFNLFTGQVHMITSPEEPAKIAHVLQNLDEDLDFQLENFEGSIKTGFFHWSHPDEVACKFGAPDDGTVSAAVPASARSRGRSSSGARSRLNVRADTGMMSSQFHAVFHVSSSKRKLHNVLTWKSYTMLRKSKLNDRLMDSTELDLRSEHFRPLVFSRVKFFDSHTEDRPL